MRIILALLLLVPSQAFATQRVWIAEFASARVEAVGPIATLPALVRQTVDTTTGVQTSQAFNKNTRYIRIVCEVQCAIAVGQVATPNATLLPALRPEYFFVTPGASLSVIAAP